MLAHASIHDFARRESRGWSAGACPRADNDPAAYLDSPEAIAAYLDEALASGDAAFVADALGVVARARGMSQVARDSGLSRESLYRALSADGNPGLETVLRVIRTLGLKLMIQPTENS